jgi:tRNA U34 5-carboxymethylaminomethyl modifying GTPase MnmE/TrmE
LIEQAAIAASRGPTRAADLRLLVLDPTQPTPQEQRALLTEFPDAIRIINKSDRPAAWDISGIADTAIRTIATIGEGIAELRSAIARHFGCDAIDVNQPRWWTERQREVLNRATEDPMIINELLD